MTLNHIYRLVWSDVQEAWIAVSEITRAHGKRHAKALRLALPLLFLTLGALAQVAPTTVVPTGTGTSAYVSANGVPVVNIKASNAAGLSHNQFLRYDVDSKGLVLNNGNLSQIERQSKLAGRVLANPNLVQEASIILNEVVTTNRSQLAGFTEVVGGRADVVVANPNGITCSGCRFINTDRVTLTTGAPVFGSNGGLSGFNVERGDLLIQGAGFDASAQQVLDLVARSIKLDAPVIVSATGSLQLVGGTNKWSYDTRNVTGGVTGSGPVPSYAIDSTALGGMYAGRIRLIATEAGVGVRMLGNAAASAQDFELNSVGQIVIQSKLSAERDLGLSSQATGAGAISATDSSLSARRDIVITADIGGLTLAGGMLSAANKLSYAVQTLTDASTTTLGDNNKRYAGADFSLTVPGTVWIDGVSLGAGGHLGGNIGSLAVGTAGATLYGNTISLGASSDLHLGTAAVRAAGDLSLGSSGGSIEMLAGTGQGVQSTGGDISLRAATSLHNAGVVSADTGSVSIAAGALDNSGTVHAGNALRMSDLANAGSESLTNSGRLLADTLLNIQAATTSNAPTGLIRGGSVTAITTGNLDNQGKLILGTASSGSTVLTLDTLTNSGLLQADSPTTINVATLLDNSGEMLGMGNLAIRGTDSAYQINNAGRVQTSGLLDIKGWNDTRGVDVLMGKQAVAMGGALDIKSGLLSIDGDGVNGGVVSAANGLTIDSSSLQMNGAKSRLVGATSGSGMASIIVANALTNYGHIHSGYDLNLRAPSVVNTTTGAISALHDLTIGDPSPTPTGILLANMTNSGSLYAGHGLTVAATSTITNESDGVQRMLGTIDSGGTIDLTANTLVNHSSINASGDITITANTFRNGQDNRTSSTSTPVTTHWDDYHGYVFYNITTTYYTSTWTVTESYVGGKQQFTPQIVSDATLKIANFTTGKNWGGLLSGKTVNINTTKPGASFDNVDLAIETVDYTKTSTRVQECYPILVFPYCDIYGTAPNTIRSGGGVTANASAVIKAQYFDAGGFDLHNISATDQANPVAKSVPGASSIVEIAVPAFTGLVLSLPSNPNGYFVPAANSNTKYLVETNPLYLSGSSFGGSDYLLTGLGIDPESTQKRLGDANYEAYLIRQQLIQKTGSNLLSLAADEAAQMKRMMAEAVGESKELALSIGTALTPAQQAALKHDIVWMVEVTVGGQKVLAPVVYLSAETRNSIQSGAVIAAKDVKMDLASLTNTGGTISGASTLDVTTKGDLTNTSGVIKGGDVKLKSTEGSIINETAVEGMGGDQAYATTIGKTGKIESTGNLSLDAAKDIKVLGADVKAGGSGALTAGRDIIVDTIVDKTTSTTHSAGAAGVMTQSDPTTTTTTTERNIGSSIVTGGNLNLKSGGDTTLAGSKATVGGNLGVDTGGDFKVLSREDKTITHTESEKSGFGVGGGLWGTEKTTTDDLVGKNVGSSITVGGDAAIKAGKDMTLQGSDLAIAGSGSIDAQSVKILEGKDEHRTTTKTETTTFLSTGSSTGSSATASSNASSGLAAASADASASAGANESSELNLMEKRTTTVDYSKTTSVGSRLSTGGNLAIKARETATVQGSSVEAGKDLSVDAKRIEVLAGTNEEKTTTTTSATKIGVYTDSKADASAEASASATGMSASTRASAGAQASAESTATIGTRVEDSTTQTTDVTHTASSLKSGGDMSLKAKEEAKFVGAKVDAGRDLNIEAKDITNLAAEDSKVTTSSSTTTTAGVYLSGAASAKAEAEAKGGAGLLGAGAKAEAEASAEAGAGLRVAREEKSSEQGSTRNVVSTFKAGRDVTRQASGTITDQGTQLEAGRDIKQSATTIKEIAADDKTWSKESSEKHDARVGVYAGASAKAGASAQGGVAGKDSEVKAEADASAGLKAKYTNEKSSSESSSTKAVTSRYKAGGSISSTSKEKTSLIGTQFEAGKDVTIEAKSLDYKAARDTSSSSSSKRTIEAEVKAKLVGSAGAEASGAYDQSSSSSSSSTARAGGINAGGNVTVRTKNDARLEGTDISAGKKAKVESTSGNVVLDAAKSTSSSQSQGFNVNASIGTSKKAGKDGKAGERENEGALGGGYSNSKSGSTTSKGASIKGREVDVSAAKDVTLEGTQVKSAGDTSVKAGGAVKLLEAKDSSKSSSVGVKADGKASKESQSGSVNVKVGTEDKQTGKATQIESGGDTTIKGKRVTSQEAEVTSGGKTKIEGPVTKIQKTNVDKGVKLDVGVDAVRKPKAESKDKSGSETKKSDTATDDKAAGSDAKTAGKAPVKVKTPPKPKKKARPVKTSTPVANPPAGGAAPPAPAGATEH